MRAQHIRERKPVRKGIPPVPLNPSRRRRDGRDVYADTRRRHKQEGGLFQGEDEGEARRNLLLREERGPKLVRSIVFCSVKRWTRLLLEGTSSPKGRKTREGGQKRREERDSRRSFYWGGCESGETDDRPSSARYIQGVW